MSVRRPCAECPWRKDTPPGQFPPERYEALRDTTGSRGNEAWLDAPFFGCHKATTEEGFYCAGWLAAVGHWHLGVRMAVSGESIPAEGLEPGIDWPDLYQSYEELLAVHGERGEK